MTPRDFFLAPFIPLDEPYRDPRDVMANPFLACTQCGTRVVWRRESRNDPCGHPADFASVCDSWSPVDGCRCQRHFGRVDHGQPALPRAL